MLIFAGKQWLNNIGIYLGVSLVNDIIVELFGTDCINN